MQEPQTDKAVMDKFIVSRSQGEKLKEGIVSFILLHMRISFIRRHKSGLYLYLFIV
jgi:hypothetical protein